MFSVSVTLRRIVPIEICAGLLTSIGWASKIVLQAGTNVNYTGSGSAAYTMTLSSENLHKIDFLASFKYDNVLAILQQLLSIVDVDIIRMNLQSVLTDAEEYIFLQPCTRLHFLLQNDSSTV